MRRKSYRVLIGIAAIISIHVTSMFIYFSYISVQNINKDRQLLPHSPRTNHDRNDNGPMTFFHVGPIKTASSSIQCNLESNPHLLNSSYYYLGKIERKCQNLHLLRGKNGGYASGVSLVNQYFVRGWLRESVLEDHPEFRQFIHEWKGGMRSRYKKGLHTLFSSEDFCGLRRITNFHNETEEYRPKMIVDFLQSTPQNVRFQLVYRDYFDWLPSLFTWSEYSAIEGARFQDFDNFGSGNGMSSIVSWRFIDDMISFEHVTDKYFLLNTKKEHTLGCNPYNLWKHLKKFIPLFDEGRASLEILDIFHNHGNYSHDTAMETEDIGTRYICKLPNATLACQGSRNMTFGRSNPTPMDFIHADRIAVAAWRNGLFADPEAVKPKRKAVVDSIIRRVREDLNVTFLDLPLECLSEEKLGRLFQTSVIMSKEMMGEDGFYCVDVMKERFQRNVDQKKYCSVKIDAILADESWREFLKMADLT